MNRLQKKCAIATVGIHLLLLTILIVGPAFFNQRPKQDSTQVLDVIPANLIDAAFNSGVKNATPPPPTPIQSQPQPPQPQIQPTPPITPPKPVEPTPSLMEKMEKIFKSEPTKPVPPKPETHRVEPNLKPVIRTGPQNVANPRDAKAIAKAIKNLKNNLKPGTVVDAPGNGTIAYASYKDALATIYYNAWITPDNSANSDAAAIVKITIASDGTIISSHIIISSGDASVDASVQRALERVTSVPPLPDKSKGQQEFTMSFNLKTKQMFE